MARGFVKLSIESCDTKPTCLKENGVSDHADIRRKLSNPREQQQCAGLEVAVCLGCLKSSKEATVAAGGQGGSRKRKA